MMGGVTPRKNLGFTIVELLIVVVVIAILAAITIVAYNGIQARAYDSTVRSDLSQVMKKLEIYKVDNGSYPSTSEAELIVAKLNVTRDSYDTTINDENFYYCRDLTADRYGVVVRSKSGQRLYIDPNGSGVQTYATAVWGSNNICTQIGMTSYTRAVGKTAAGWRPWAGVQ